MRRERLAKDIMTRNPITVNSNEVMLNVIHIFKSSNIYGIYVLENNKVVGIFTRYDIKRLSQDTLFYPIKSLMSKTVYTIPPHTPVSEIRKTLSLLKINSLAVIENEELVGIVTRYDLNKFNKNYFRSHNKYFKSK